MCIFKIHILKKAILRTTAMQTKKKLKIVLDRQQLYCLSFSFLQKNNFFHFTKSKSLFAAFMSFPFFFRCFWL